MWLDRGEGGSSRSFFQTTPAEVGMSIPASRYLRPDVFGQRNAVKATTPIELAFACVRVTVHRK